VTEPIRLEVYREKPAEIRYSKGEHAAVCRWCVWNRYGMRCYEPTISTVDKYGWHWTYKLNPSARCERYVPSLWTRILQLLRLRPWIERPRDD